MYYHLRAKKTRWPAANAVAEFSYIPNCPKTFTCSRIVNLLRPSNYLVLFI